MARAIFSLFSFSRFSALGWIGFGRTGSTSSGSAVSGVDPPIGDGVRSRCGLGAFWSLRASRPCSRCWLNFRCICDFRSTCSGVTMVVVVVVVVAGVGPIVGLPTVRIGRGSRS
jgi:hypothetical protein